MFVETIIFLTAKKECHMDYIDQQFKVTFHAVATRKRL